MSQPALLQAAKPSRLQSTCSGFDYLRAHFMGFHSQLGEQSSSFPRLNMSGQA